jgi:hypothetical protein
MLEAFTLLFPKLHKYVASTAKNVNDGRKDAEQPVSG